MARVGQKTSKNDGHTHELLADGKTSPGKKNGHTHTWKVGAKRTSTDDGHDHGLPKSPGAK